ncbi:MAG: hypothetical protein JXR95_14935 [Deltaproteobacteria bacterium]|nr:hypothetical protein [Deltaproteobacteria bacterium]
MIRLCPECKIELSKIIIADNINGGIVKSGLEYTLDDEIRTRALRGGMKNRSGIINGYLCTKCSRVLLYATKD